MPNYELPNSSEVYKLQVEQQIAQEKEFTRGLIFAPIIVIVFLVVGCGLLYLITTVPAVDQAIDAPRIINDWRSIVGAPPYVAP